HDLAIGRDMRATPFVTATALPHDRRVQRFSRRPIEHDNRFALVGDAQACKIRHARRVPSDELTDDTERVMPNLFRIVFHPTGSWVVLSMFSRRAVDGGTGSIE